jgi:hypothetical protein
MVNKLFPGIAKLNVLFDPVWRKTTQPAEIRSSAAKTL